MEDYTTTDIILETPEGEYIHIYIPDRHPATAYIREHSTIRVKRTETVTPIERAIYELTRA